jgi:surface protein
MGGASRHNRRWFTRRIPVLQISSGFITLQLVFLCAARTANGAGNGSARAGETCSSDDDCYEGYGCAGVCCDSTSGYGITNCQTCGQQSPGSGSFVCIECMPGYERFSWSNGYRCRKECEADEFLKYSSDWDCTTKYSAGHGCATNNDDWCASGKCGEDYCCSETSVNATWDTFGECCILCGTSGQCLTKGACPALSFTDLATLKAAVSSCVGDSQCETHLMPFWDVSQVTDMSGLFKSMQVTGDISNWDVSSVTNMDEMFRGSAFNGDISAWDVSRVTSMNQMFEGASAFEADITGWTPAVGVSVSEMFGGATAWNAAYVNCGMFIGDPFQSAVPEVCENTCRVIQQSPLEVDGPPGAYVSKLEVPTVCPPPPAPPPAQPPESDESDQPDVPPSSPAPPPKLVLDDEDHAPTLRDATFLLAATALLFIF